MIIYPYFLSEKQHNTCIEITILCKRDSALFRWLCIFNSADYPTQSCLMTLPSAYRYLISFAFRLTTLSSRAKELTARSCQHPGKEPSLLASDRHLYILYPGKKKKKKKKPFSSVKSWECPLVPYCPIVFQGKLLHMIVLFYRNVLSQRNSRDCELTILPISERRMRTIRGHSDKAMSTQVNSCLLMNMRQRTIYLPWNYHKSQTNEKKRKNEQKSVTLLVINPTAMWPIILIGLIIFLENTSINRVGPPLWYHIPNKTQLPLKKK